MKKHYVLNDDLLAACGRYVSDNEQISNHGWGDVTCKNCLKKKEQIKNIEQIEEEDICQDLGRMGRWWLTGENYRDSENSLLKNVEDVDKKQVSEMFFDAIVIGKKCFGDLSSALKKVIVNKEE
ncbi:MAG: hypothetical protein GY679_01580 [Mycoplasma sp.]|nr:hypothetical protein [Mycoplasma sp.]